MEWLEVNGYDTPNGMPLIEVKKMPWDRMYYDPERKVIYVSSAYAGTDAEKGMLIHEIWHHQQEHPQDCETVEREAYEVQHEWYRQKGVPTYKRFVDISVLSSCDPMNWPEIVRLKAEG